MTFNQEQAIKDYTELMRRIHVGAYTERSAEDYETGTYPEDGVEQSIHHLEMLAAKHGLVFHWHKDTQIYSLEPISDEEEATSPPFSPPEKESDDDRRSFSEEEMLLLVKETEQESAM